MRKYDNFEFEAPLVTAKTPDNLEVIIAIPAFNEKDIFLTLNSLLNNIGYNTNIEVIIVLNESEDVDANITDFHQKQLRQLISWAEDVNAPKLSFYPIFVKGIKKKIAGAGMARKIAMDEAFRRFEKAGNLYGIISNLDADTIVENNYLYEIEKESLKRNKIKAYSIHFEHLLSKDLSDHNKLAIISYELHLRYFINMQKQLKLPFAYQIMGSAMAVKAFAYGEAFGMNKRQAGEDFYFLQKFIKTGQFANINSTTVHPSARVSQRVPFGTGRAIYDILTLGKTPETYNYKSFISLRSLTDNLDIFYTDYSKGFTLLDKPVSEYLQSKKFNKIYLQIKNNTKDFTGFRKRFFQWFDAFLLMKYLHYARDHYYPNIQIDIATDYLFKQLNLNSNISLEKKLDILQLLDKKSYTKP